MWPVMTSCSLIVICTSAELCSAYPVAGAMATWTWIMARRGVGGERYWGWLMGGMVAGYHIANASRSCGGNFANALISLGAT
jgi:hypothetical protein